MRRKVQESSSSKPLNACEKDEGWKRMSIAADSGACDNVISPEELPAYEGMITETKASINHEDFVSATGDPIANYGELKIAMVTRERSIRGMVFQAAGVAKPLCSVDRLIEANHIVLFDSEGSYIWNKRTGEINMLRRDEGNFMLDVYVPPPKTSAKMGFARQP